MFIDFADIFKVLVFCWVVCTFVNVVQCDTASLKCILNVLKCAVIQNEFKKIFNAFRFHSQTLSMFSNALKMICNAFERFQNALKWKNSSTEFLLSLVFPNRVTYADF